MRKSRFSEEQIIAFLLGDLLQVEGEVRRAGRVGRPQAEDAGERERPAEAAAGRGRAGQGRSEGPSGKRLTTPPEKRDAALKAMSKFDISQRRATRLTEAPGTCVCAMIARFSSSDHFRRCRRRRAIPPR